MSHKTNPIKLLSLGTFKTCVYVRQIVKTQTLAYFSLSQCLWVNQLLKVKTLKLEIAEAFCQYSSCGIWIRLKWWNQPLKWN